MVSLTIELPEEEAAKLKDLATERHTTLEQVVLTMIKDTLLQPGEGFDQEIEVLLDKHHELLQRLA